MLLGLAGAALPVIIHLLNRRRDTVIDWGAMQFLELGKNARRKVRLSELLLMLARMGLLALAALGARRGRSSRITYLGAADPGDGWSAYGADAPRLDIVLVIDG